MRRAISSVLILALIGGCVQTSTTAFHHRSADSALFGKRTEADGREYLRVGKLLIQTKGDRSE